MTVHRMFWLATLHGATRVRAEVFGDWCVHLVSAIESNTSCRGYRVSHVPTGRSIGEAADDMDIADARAVAQSLDDTGFDPIGPDAKYIACAIIGEALAGPVSR